MSTSWRTTGKHYRFRRHWAVRRLWARWDGNYRTIPNAAVELGVEEDLIVGWLDGRELPAYRLGSDPEAHIDLQDVADRGLMAELDPNESSDQSLH